VNRSPSASPATTASNAARFGVGLPLALEMTAPRGTPAAPKMYPGFATYTPFTATLKWRAIW
jgi:hypothetical protein